MIQTIAMSQILGTLFSQYMCKIEVLLIRNLRLRRPSVINNTKCLLLRELKENVREIALTMMKAWKFKLGLS